MAKIKTYHIFNTINKTSKFTGTYDSCLNEFNLQDKAYRKIHKIISDEEYQKIIKKKPNK